MSHKVVKITCACRAKRCDVCSKCSRWNFSGMDPLFWVCQKAKIWSPCMVEPLLRRIIPSIVNNSNNIYINNKLFDKFASSFYDSCSTNFKYLLSKFTSVHLDVIENIALLINGKITCMKQHKRESYKVTIKTFIEEKVNFYVDRRYWTSIIAEEIQWFYFQYVIIHSDNHFYEHPNKKLLQLTLNCFLYLWIVLTTVRRI